MRTHILFIIFWILLVVFRVNEVLSDLCQYRLTSGAEKMMRATPGRGGDADEQLGAVLDQKQQCLQSAALAGVEIVILGGVWFCFFRAWRIRKETASQDVWTRRAKNA